MKNILLVIFLTLASVGYVTLDDLDPVWEEMIDHINSMNTTWKAGRNFEGASMEHIKGLHGILPDSFKDRLPKITVDVPKDLPKTFDARKHWPECQTIGQISDQGSCGASWIIPLVDFMSDRYCIHSNGSLKVKISAEDLLTCCNNCGHGCEGGYPQMALKYWIRYGVVTGGPYDSHIGCRTYSTKPCEHYVKGKRPKCGDTVPTPQCIEKCEKGYNISYSDDKHFGKDSYFVPDNVAEIQTEIYKKGTIAGGMLVYEDFLTYKSGVYKHETGSHVNTFGFRILGWGTENETPYWLVANSWNTDWGDKGYFKVLRGSNECGIESMLLAGMPRFKK